VKPISHYKKVLLAGLIGMTRHLCGDYFSAVRFIFPPVLQTHLMFLKIVEIQEFVCAGNSPVHYGVKIYQHHRRNSH